MEMYITEEHQVQIGEKIIAKRTEMGMTQEELAAEVCVTAQAVSQWERGRTIPDVDRIPLIADALHCDIRELITGEENYQPRWVLKESIFSAEHMYSRLKGYTEIENLPQTHKALVFMKNAHEGMYRKKVWFSSKRIPYITHPLMMACQAHALGLIDDNILAAILLHDVCEDCGVTPEDLPVSKRVQDAVRLLTFQTPEGLTKAEAKALYFQEIRKDKIAAIVKVIDRCNNISTMAAAFSREKQIEYIDETETYVIPLLDYLKDEHMEYHDAVFLIKYHMLSVLETFKNMILH